MRQTTLISVACVALSMLATWAQTADSTLTARPIQILSCASLPDGMAFDIKPMGHKAGFEVYYLVTGSGFAAFKEGSLVMSSIKTREGVDISRSRTGKPSYEQGSFPKVSEDGRYAVFSVEVDQEQFGKVESLSMRGSIVILTASKREEKSLAMPVAAKTPKPLGPFTVVPLSGVMGMMMSEDTIGIKIKGPLSSIIDVELVAGAATQKSESNMSDGSSKTFFFNKPPTASVTLKINYWTDLKEQKVTFGQ